MDLPEVNRALASACEIVMEKLDHKYDIVPNRTGLQSPDMLIARFEFRQNNEYKSGIGFIINIKDATFDDIVDRAEYLLTQYCKREFGTLKS